MSLNGAATAQVNALPERDASAHGARAIAVCGVIFLAAAVLLPWVGAGPVDVHRVLHRAAPDYQILVELRISRVLLALLAGGALSLAGTLFQAMLRDALATPYTLGISAGASLGAVVAIAAGAATVLGIPSTTLGAMTGAFLVLLLVAGGSLRRRPSAFGLLLSGIAINSVCAALILVLSGFAGVARAFSITRWLIGSVDAVGYESLAWLAAVVLAASAYVLSQARGWNLLSVGEDWAATRGVRPVRLLAGGYLAGSVLVAAAIALTGPIGFVGLIVPHAVRNRVSPDHRVLMPCAFLLGGVLLALSDAIGRVVLAPAEISAGAVLALLGGPYLVWIIRRRVEG
jgi:iron complex transport system permease protein